MKHQFYLKDRSYYEDRYDRMIVEQCRLTEKAILENGTKIKLTHLGKKLIWIALMKSSWWLAQKAKNT